MWFVVIIYINIYLQWNERKGEILKVYLNLFAYYIDKTTTILILRRRKKEMKIRKRLIVMLTIMSMLIMSVNCFAATKNIVVVDI